MESEDDLASARPRQRRLDLGWAEQRQRGGQTLPGFVSEARLLGRGCIPLRPDQAPALQGQRLQPATRGQERADGLVPPAPLRRVQRRQAVLGSGADHRATAAAAGSLDRLGAAPRSHQRRHQLAGGHIPGGQQIAAPVAQRHLVDLFVQKRLGPLVSGDGLGPPPAQRQGAGATDDRPPARLARERAGSQLLQPPVRLQRAVHLPGRERRSTEEVQAPELDHRVRCRYSWLRGGQRPARGGHLAGLQVREGQVDLHVARLPRRRRTGAVEIERPFESVDGVLDRADHPGRGARLPGDQLVPGQAVEEPGAIAGPPAVRLTGETAKGGQRFLEPADRTQHGRLLPPGQPRVQLLIQASGPQGAGGEGLQGLGQLARPLRQIPALHVSPHRRDPARIPARRTLDVSSSGGHIVPAGQVAVSQRQVVADGRGPRPRTRRLLRGLLAQ